MKTILEPPLVKDTSPATHSINGNCCTSFWKQHRRNVGYGIGFVACLAISGVAIYVIRQSFVGCSPLNIFFGTGSQPPTQNTAEEDTYSTQDHTTPTPRARCSKIALEIETIDKKADECEGILKQYNENNKGTVLWHNPNLHNQECSKKLKSRIDELEDSIPLCPSLSNRFSEFKQYIYNLHAKINCALANSYADHASDHLSGNAGPEEAESDHLKWAKIHIKLGLIKADDTICPEIKLKLKNLATEHGIKV